MAERSEADNLKFESMSEGKKVEDIIPNGALNIFYILLAQKILHNKRTFINFRTSSQALLSRLRTELMNKTNALLEEEKDSQINVLLEKTNDPQTIYQMTGDLRMFVNEFYPLRNKVSEYIELREKWSKRFAIYPSTNSAHDPQ